MLELTDLARRYGDVVALDGITFSVAPGQLYGFVGPNGAGKTTTMGDLVTAVGMSPLWFVIGYAFFACAFACAGALVPLAAAALLIPLAARIYSGAVLRTGSAIRLREAWRAASAPSASARG